MKNNRNFQNMEIGRSLWTFTKKIPLVMKLFIFYLFCSISMLQAVESYAQNARLSLNVEEETVANILQQIENASDFDFFYNNSHVDLDRRVSVSAHNSDIFTILNEVFEGTEVHYTVLDKKIILSTELEASAQGIKQQGNVVKGKVVDMKGEPVIGATIKEMGTNNGAITDIDGNFSITVQPNASLEISFIGYKTEIQKAVTGKTLAITLKEDNEMLDEVVVVGYGTVKKRDLTGSVSSVRGSDLEKSGAPSIAHSLGGKAAGLYVRQNSAQPGGGLDILVRGAGSINANNTPLYIVDGFPIAQLNQLSGSDAKMDPGTQGILNFLNPNDVESIEVLKDASATSIYGARAANGVVIITTKRGKEGKAKVNYSYNYSFQKYADKYDLLSLSEWMEEKNKTTWEFWIWNNKVAPWGNRTLEEAINNPVNGLAYERPYTEEEIANAGQGTDWLGLITRNGQIQEHNLSVQGGSKETQYALSFNYYTNDGIVKNSGMDRYTLKANFDQKFLDIFKIGTNLTLTRIENDNTQLGSAQYENSGIIRSAIQMGPHIKAYDPETGEYPINPLLGTQPNPYSLLNNIDKGTVDRFLGNIFLEATPIDGLTLKVNAGIDKAEQKRRTYQPKTTLNGNKLQGVGAIYNVDNNQYLLEGTATYSKVLADIHQINLLAGTSYEQFNYESSNLSNNNFLTDGFIYNNLGAGTGVKGVRSGYSENKMLSYFFRSNYILKNRYLLTATLRADGASVFARNHKWGYFPSVALGWTISEESFMKKASSWLDILKLRLSWGQTGNSQIVSNAFAAYYASNAWNKEDGSKEKGVFQRRLENPDLKWETTTEWNLGIDIGLFKNRLSATIELYQKVISDLLNYKPLNTYQEITSVIANVGKTQSRGIEVTLNSKNIVSKDFFWSTDLTFTKYQDRWKERTPDWKPNVYEQYDAPIRAMYSRRASHILQIGEEAPAAQPDLKPGQLVIKDLNGYVRDENGDPAVDENGRFMLLGHPDGIIDDADTELIGTSDPGWLAGMTNTFKYKNFDLTIQLNGMFDRLMQDPTAMTYGISGDGIARYGYNALRSIKNRWTWDNPSTKHPSTFNGWENTYGSGDWFLQKAWFIRAQNITLGYNVPNSFLQKTKYISSLRLYASINNAFIITPYEGLDPETDYYTAAYPNARTFTMGINVSF